MFFDKSMELFPFSLLSIRYRENSPLSVLRYTWLLWIEKSFNIFPFWSKQFLFQKSRFNFWLVTIFFPEPIIADFIKLNSLTPLHSLIQFLLLLICPIFFPCSYKFFLSRSESARTISNFSNGKRSFLSVFFI